ncbi:MAG: hypothetical protein IJS50_01535 [Desulfovibrio sp.]|nr:hypothetical protein [Desulfovibrio sp.]
MQEENFVLLELACENVSPYIFASASLKQILLCNEKVAQITDKVLSFCAQDLGLKKLEEPKQGDEAWYVLVEQSLGGLKLLLPKAELAKQVLACVSLWAIEECPGLELYGAFVPASFTSESLAQASLNSASLLHNKRLNNLQPFRLTWSFSKIAARDGFPAVGQDEKEQYVSVNNLQPCPKELGQKIANAQKELEEAVYSELKLAKTTKLQAVEDLEQLAKACPSKKVALVRVRVKDVLGLEQKLQKSLAKRPLREQLAGVNKLKVTLAEALRTGLVTGLAKAMASEQGDLASNSTLPLFNLLWQQTELFFFMRSDLVFTLLDTMAASYESSMKKQGLSSTLQMGMVVMQAKYPLSRALTLCSELVEHTGHPAFEKKSSHSLLDYVVLTNEIETDIPALRKRSYTAVDGSLLTAKPFVLGQPRQKMGTSYQPEASLADIVADTKLLSSAFPSSFLRQAIDDCHAGQGKSKSSWERLVGNLKRDANKQKTVLPSFERIFADGFFITRPGAAPFTLLGDYLELRHLFAPVEK